MAFHIIIDGYNLIRNYPPLSRVEAADFAQGRNFLLEWLAEYKRESKNAVTVIFDGGKGGELLEERSIYKGIKVLYSRWGQTADDLIKRLSAHEGEKAMVVSSDRDLCYSCRSFKATTIRSEEFAHLIVEKGRRSFLRDT
ncbi:MAG TPA: NYN domain-containing protein, partial [Thermodesulfobacteriota bacterium]|nr:NYN domain-containing protein [Thermodesulfobacteriota bacterium]